MLSASADCIIVHACVSVSVRRKLTLLHYSKCRDGNASVESLQEEILKLRREQSQLSAVQARKVEAKKCEVEALKEHCNLEKDALQQDVIRMLALVTEHKSRIQSFTEEYAAAVAEAQL